MLRADEDKVERLEEVEWLTSRVESSGVGFGFGLGLGLDLGLGGLLAVGRRVGF